MAWKEHGTLPTSGVTQAVLDAAIEKAVKALPAPDVHKADLDALEKKIPAAPDVTKAEVEERVKKAEATADTAHTVAIAAADNAKNEAIATAATERKAALDALEKKIPPAPDPYTGGAGIKVDGKTISATADDPAVKPVAQAVEALKENVDKIAKKVGAT